MILVLNLLIYKKKRMVCEVPSRLKSIILGHMGREEGMEEGTWVIHKKKRMLCEVSSRLKSIILGLTGWEERIEEGTWQWDVKEKSGCSPWRFWEEP